MTTITGTTTTTTSTGSGRDIVAVGIVSIFVAMLIHCLEKIPESTLRDTQLLPFHPDRYHGIDKHSHFFEGWYYKLVRPASSSSTLPSLSMAVVPGIFRGTGPDDPESHAFIFVTVNGEQQHYYRFDVNEFLYASPGEEFYIQIGSNVFTHSGIYLNIHPQEGDDATLSLTGQLNFTNVSPWPVSFFHLGAMGPIGWMPFLECSHGVLSFDHELSGSLLLNGMEESFHNGRGYTEKDHGRSFPSLWIWLQSNSFRNSPGTSLFISIARVPLPLWGLDFPGFIAAVWHEGQLIPFATYTMAKFQDLIITDDEIYISIQGGQYRLELSIDRRDVPHVLLYAPVNFTKMAPSVNEALNAKVHMRLYKNNQLLLDDIGDHAGLEVHQNVDYLVDNLCGKPTANKLMCL